MHADAQCAVSWLDFESPLIIIIKKLLYIVLSKNANHLWISGVIYSYSHSVNKYILNPGLTKWVLAYDYWKGFYDYVIGGKLERDLFSGSIISFQMSAVCDYDWHVVVLYGYWVVVFVLCQLCITKNLNRPKMVCCFMLVWLACWPLKLVKLVFSSSSTQQKMFFKCLSSPQLHAFN